MNKKIIISTVAILVVIIAGIMWWQNSHQKYIGPVEKIRLGAPALGNDLSELIWVAEDQGYFALSGLDIAITFPPSTLEIQQELKDGELDLGVATEFSYITGILDTDPLKAKIVAVIDKAKSIEVIGRKDRGISKPADLKGKKIAVFKKTANEFFLGIFLLTSNLTFKNVQLVDLPPDKAKGAILSGDVDAAVISEPFAYQTKKALAENAVSWSAQGDTYLNWIVMGSDKFIKDHPKAIERFLKALVQAEEYVQKNPDKSEDLLVKKFNLEQPYIVYAWPKHKYSVSLDQSLILILENQTRWSIANKLTNKTVVPNYSDFIYTNALRKVKLDAVTIY